MARPGPERRKPGRPTGRAEREDAKKAVALSKADQKRDMALKAFAVRQKAMQKDLAAAEALKRSLDEMLTRIEADRALDARFMGQVIKKVKALRGLDKALAADEAAFAEVVAQPRVYAEVIASARKMPAPAKVQTYGDLSILLAMLIVILRRVLALKPRR